MLEVDDDDDDDETVNTNTYSHNNAAIKMAYVRLPKTDEKLFLLSQSHSMSHNIY